MSRSCSLPKPRKAPPPSSTQHRDRNQLPKERALFSSRPKELGIQRASKFIPNEGDADSLRFRLWCHLCSETGSILRASRSSILARLFFFGLTRRALSSRVRKEGIAFKFDRNFDLSFDRVRIRSTFVLHASFLGLSLKE
jgi:hypothetical protein